MGLREQRPRGRRKSLDAVFADADQRQPFFARGRGHGGERKSFGNGPCGFSFLAGHLRRASSRTFLRDKLAFRPCCRSPAAPRRLVRHKFPIGSAVLAVRTDLKPISRPSESTCSWTPRIL